MHDVVRLNFHSEPAFSKRLPSFAGQGLPERMRSTAFVLLGLTAAAGLSLVAIFAQLGFPLLSPAPMPSDPSQANAVAEAKPLQRDAGGPKAVAVEPARNAVAVSRLRDGGGAAGSKETREGEAGVEAPSAPVSTPAPGGAEPAEIPAPAPAPEPAPAPSPAPTSSAPEPAPEPEAAPAAPPAPPRPAATSARAASPAPSAGPGRSRSAAAAAHASSRGIEASSKSTAAPAPVPAAAPPASPPPPQAAASGKGNGKALGHSK